MTSKLREIERDNRLAEQPWRRGDRYDRMYNPDGSLKDNSYNNFGMRGGGRGGNNNSFGRGNNNNNFSRGGAGRGGGGIRLPTDQAGLDNALANWNNQS